MAETKLKSQAINKDTWHNVTFENSWTNFGSDYETAQYYKDALGFVHLRGLIKDGGVTDPTTIFTLPAGYRPAGKKMVHVVCSATPSTITEPTLRILSTGVVQTRSVNNTWVSLDGISFLAEA